ncbi:hypothetical protein ACIRCZ_19720 [Leifsonia sp. NPDC102414]|uniref:hypothetical protein n=1 Tax=Leifsonia sp. NPDC102414 TaxID=3364124 RepID=UPI0038259056
MKSSKRFIPMVLGASVTTVVMVAVGGVPANADTAGSEWGVVAKAAPESASGVAEVVTTTAGVSAIDASLAGTEVTIPVDPSSTITMTTRSDRLRIGLPFAATANNAAVQAPGVVSYDNGNGSTTLPVVRTDGSVQIDNVIENAAAPTRYEYPLTSSAGQTARVSPDGSVYVGGAAGTTSFYFAPPWAKDAAGATVPTHYELDGGVLVQVVNPTSSTSFPVVTNATVVATGQYDYNCVLTDGSSYFMRHGEALTDCKGSYLQKYLDGRLIKSVGLVYNGGASVQVTGKGGCLLTLGGIAALVFYPPTSTFGWVLSGALAAGGVSQSCTGF